MENETQDQPEIEPKVGQDDPITLDVPEDPVAAPAPAAHVPGAPGAQPKIKPKTKPQPQPKAKSKYIPGQTSVTAQKWPQFREALEAGDLETVKKLIAEGVNANVTRDGSTPLFIAASAGRRDLAETLIQAGANVNAKDPDEWTALHKAAFDQAGTDIVEYLLHSGVDVNALTVSKKTALQLAEESGHGEVAKYIKKHLQALQADAAEWTAFLNTPEGLPFKQKKLLETIDGAFRFWWAPPAALLPAGLLFGLIFGSAGWGGVIGLVCGVLVDVAALVLQSRAGSYLAQFEPLPFLDMQVLRAKRKAHEDLGVKKRADGQSAGSVMLSTVSVASQPAAAAPEAAAAVEKAEEKPEKRPQLQPQPQIQPQSQPQLQPSAAAPEAADAVEKAKEKPEKRPQSQPQTAAVTEVNPWVISAIAAALLLVLLAGALLVYKEQLLHWYYAKKVVQQGMQFTDAAFLDEVAKNNEDAVDLFLRAGVNPEAVNGQGRTALMIASELGHDRLYTKLLDLSKEALDQTDAKGNTALMLAARQGRERIVRSLVERGAAVNHLSLASETGATALQAAVDVPNLKEEHVAIIRILLEKGADVNSRNAAGRTPLLLAAARGRTEIAEMLIDRGADPNALDWSGDFALRSAAAGGQAKLIALLAQKGAGLRTALPDGVTPLMEAVQHGHLAAARTLLDLGVPVNAVAANGSTALGRACAAGSVEAANLLLQRGADPESIFPPPALTLMNGKTIAIKAAKSRLGEVIKRLASPAFQDGYRINAVAGMDRALTLRATGAWNKVLIDLAARNNLLLVVKDREITVLPYDPAGIVRDIPAPSLPR
ncbi:MAG: ankyrin repeat domain-containing protein [Nitrospirota bacterium]|nr:ankyrin repeat domain-containing protein [Nitrospirota bacterium]